MPSWFIFTISTNSSVYPKIIQKYHKISAKFEHEFRLFLLSISSIKPKSTFNYLQKQLFLKILSALGFEPRTIVRLCAWHITKATYDTIVISFHHTYQLLNLLIYFLLYFLWKNLPLIFLRSISKRNQNNCIFLHNRKHNESFFLKKSVDTRNRT